MTNDEYIKTQTYSIQFFHFWATKFRYTDLGELFWLYKGLNSNLPEIDPFYVKNEEISLTESLYLKLDDNSKNIDLIDKSNESQIILSTDNVEDIFNHLSKMIENSFKTIKENCDLFKQELLSSNINHSIIDNNIVFHDYNDYRINLYEITDLEELKKIVDFMEQDKSNPKVNEFNWETPDPSKITFNYTKLNEEDLLNSDDFIENI
jgi:hypothetical protein